MEAVFNMSAILSAVTLIILSYVSVKLSVFIYKYTKKSAALKKFPHDPMHWFWGHLKTFPPVPNQEALKWKVERVGRFPDACLTWFGPFLPDVTLFSPKEVKTILKTAEPKGFSYKFLKPWLGDGLLLSKGEKWARNRRLLTPAFHFEILKPYLEIKNKAADKLCSKIRKYAESEEYFEECFLITMFTLDVILKCAFSYETDCQDVGTNHPYVQLVNELGRIFTVRFMNPLLHPDWIFNLTKDGKLFKKHCEHLHKISEDIIAQRKQTLEENVSLEKEKVERNRRTDFLDILLLARDENNVGLTDIEIRDEVDTFLFEGHDTTASAIYWTLFSLAEHGQIQDRVQQEIDTLMKGRDSDDLLASDLNQIPYLTMCIKESLRLHSPVSFIQRQPENEFNINGTTLPKDTMTSIHIYATHHNPTVWENSLQFRPERFSPDNTKKMDPFANIPFSAGPRNCIGQNFAMHEIKVAVVKVLYRFFLDTDPNHEVKKLEYLVMRAENGIMLKATPRKSGDYRFE